MTSNVVIPFRRTTTAPAPAPVATCGPNGSDVCLNQPAAPTLAGDNPLPASVATDNAPAATGATGFVVPPQLTPIEGEPTLTTGISDGNSSQVPQFTSVTTETLVEASGLPVAASSSKGGSNLSSGAVAGVAIGALIAGALLAFAAAFFVFKRRNKNRDGNVGYHKDHNYADSSPELVMLQKGVGRNSPYVQVSQTPMPPPVASPAPVQQPPKDIIGSILPAAAHDSEIQGRISALFSAIHRHIDTFYRDAHASITPSMEPELVRFGAKDVNMAELLQDCSSPTTALKHALAAYVLGITGPRSGEDGETLFPGALRDASSHGVTSGSDSNLHTALTYHRRLSVYLYTSTSSSPTTSRRRSWSHQSDIREAAEHFSLTFFPWANPGSDDQEKEDDLTRIISEAMETRVWLYGQPSEYEFRWDGVGTRGIAVSPELVKADGTGRGRVLVESNVAGL